MSAPRIVALAGRKGVGKDEAARGVLERLYDAQRFAFADPLKAMVGQLWGFSESQLWGDGKDQEDPRYGRTARWYCQRLGGLVRGVDPAAWARALVEREIPFHPELGVAVISDLRFPQELDAVRRAQGVVIRIERPGVDPWAPGRGWWPWLAYAWCRWVLWEDVSEASVELLAAVDAVVVNDGSIDDLHGAVLTVIARHGIQPPQPKLRIGLVGAEDES